MHAGMENVDPTRPSGIPFECSENLSLNSLVPHNDWSAFRINPFSNQNMSRQMNSFGSQFLPPVEIGCPCAPYSDQRMFQQPYSMPPNQHQFWDAYWKNYWQKYYRQFDDLRPSSQPPYRPDFRREQPRFEPDFQPEYERHEEHEEHEEQEKKERREPRAKNRFEPNGRREQRPENGRTDGPGDRGGRIVSAAKESVGQQLFKFIPGTPGNLGCAASVSAALNKAGFNYAKHAGVFGLTQQLQQNGWSKHEGLQDARPGDVVVIVRRSGWQNGGGGSHIGIVGENGKVYHNSSGRQQWIEDSLQRVFGGGIQRFILRPRGA